MIYIKYIFFALSFLSPTALAQSKAIIRDKVPNKTKVAAKTDFKAQSKSYSAREAKASGLGAKIFINSIMCYHIV